MKSNMAMNTVDNDIYFLTCNGFGEPNVVHHIGEACEASQ